jgi:hypothetical protein
MEKSSQIAWKIVPLRHFFPLKVAPLIEVLLYRPWGSLTPPKRSMLLLESGTNEVRGAESFREEQGNPIGALESEMESSGIFGSGIPGALCLWYDSRPLPISCARLPSARRMRSSGTPATGSG